MEHNEKTIQKILDGFLTQPKYTTENLYVFTWESDKLIWTRTGYIYEFEVKTSRQDFKNDLRNKPEKHARLNEEFSGEKPDGDELDRLREYYNRHHKHTTTREETLGLYDREGQRQGHTPNYFYYATPENLVKEEEIPAYAGLIYINGQGQMKIQKKAPRLHGRKIKDEELSLAVKFYHNMKNYKEKYNEEKNKGKQTRKLLEEELRTKGKTMTTTQLEEKLKKTEEEKEILRQLYMTMIEAADYNTIEKRMLIDAIRKIKPEFNIRQLMEKAEEKYEERYNKKQQQRK